MLHSLPHILLASPDSELLQRLEGTLQAMPATTEVASTAEAALAALTAAEGPDVAVLDGRLGSRSGGSMELDRLLAAAPETTGGGTIPVLVLADAIDPQWIERMRDGVLADAIPLGSSADYVRLRVRRMIEAHRAAEELDGLRTAAALEQRQDSLTGVLSRAEMLSKLFTETDRVQRMGTSLCLILFDVDDFGHWNGRLGTAACDELLVQMTGRVRGLLRSYDLMGRMGADEFLAALPGCGTANAVLLAERIRSVAFAEPFHAGGKVVRLSACFAVATSQGRTPVVVLRELEEALRRAQRAGPETIETAGGCPEAAPVEFLSPTTGEDLLAW